MKVDEQTLVNFNKLVRFMQLGYNENEAAELVDANADLHLAEKLHKEGCPLELVKRIAA